MLEVTTAKLKENQVQVVGVTSTTYLFIYLLTTVGDGLRAPGPVSALARRTRGTPDSVRDQVGVVIGPTFPAGSTDQFPAQVALYKQKTHVTHARIFSGSIGIDKGQTRGRTSTFKRGPSRSQNIQDSLLLSYLPNWFKICSKQSRRVLLTASVLGYLLGGRASRLSSAAFRAHLVAGHVFVLVLQAGVAGVRTHESIAQITHCKQSYPDLNAEAQKTDALKKIVA